jgi:hypothetical protein
LYPWSTSRRVTVPVRVGVCGAVAQHRHQRDHPGAAADQVERAALVDRPCERPADRSADLELVAGDRLVDEIGSAP